MQVLDYSEAAARCGLVRRSLERIIAAGEGPPVVRISVRRCGILEDDLDAWLLTRRRVPPGYKPAPAPSGGDSGEAR